MRAKEEAKNGGKRGSTWKEVNRMMEDLDSGEKQIKLTGTRGDGLFWLF